MNKINNLVTVYGISNWDAVKADQLPDAVRFDVFDGAVNSGPVQSIKWLQRAAGAADDGILGPKTIAAAVAAGQALAARYNGHRLLFMTDLPTWGGFGKGWARRVGKNLLGAS
ncbi:putative peptidoglycan-binding domain-containing protein [Delftia acidovorans]|uniref:putative peptidoglycan-binding domain-containing protein n=1 Tax=Delftia acidovorans TaxID=80866 RepID=UPI0035A1AEA2